MIDKRERILYLDVLRIVATYAVIMIHIAAYNWRNVSVFSSEWLAMDLWDGVARGGVPVFIMISGALFLSRELTIERIYKNNISHLALAFIVWSFFYAFIGLVRGNPFDVFLFNVLRGEYHMWFLIMVIGLYMIVPLLYRIVSEEKNEKYFLVLSLAFSIVIPQIVSIVNIFYKNAGNALNGVYDNFNMHFVIGFTFYFIMGKCLNSIEPKRNTFILKALILAGIALTVILTALASRFCNEPVSMFFNYLSLNVAMTSIAFFVFVKNLMYRKVIHKRAEKFIIAMSDYSFGAYLVHVFVIALIKKIFDMDSLAFNPIMSIPIISIIVFVISFFFSFILNHIPFVKKNFV